jgi:molybdopterin synthase sulfur carrier subunit
MPVTFHIPGALREFTAGQSRVEIEHSPTTLAHALSALWTLYPGVRDRITTEQGQVREHINIFIGDENVRYTGGLASPVSTGSEISIVPAVSGGRENSRDEESVGAGPFRRGTWTRQR